MRAKDSIIYGEKLCVLASELRFQMLPERAFQSFKVSLDIDSWVKVGEGWEKGWFNHISKAQTAVYLKAEGGNWKKSWYTSILIIYRFFRHQFLILSLSLLPLRKAIYI